MSVGSFTDKECFQIELERMSTAFMAAYLAHKSKKFLTLTDAESQEIAKKCVELSHHLMIEIADCVDNFEDTK